MCEGRPIGRPSSFLDLSAQGRYFFLLPFELVLVDDDTLLLPVPVVLPC
jgi:hypothetical protein